MKHDEEKALIEHEIQTAKLEQDERSSRLARLRAKRSLPQTEDPAMINKDEAEAGIKRFSLFPEESVPETLHKKTKTQVEVEERKQLVKPVGFSDVKKSTPWYLEKKKEAVDTDLKEVLVERVPSKQKTIEDLRRERLIREAKERDRARELGRRRR